MTPAARDALALAAQQFETAAARLETAADLVRQVAEHVRRGEIDAADQRRTEVGRVIAEYTTTLAVQLIVSVKQSDPDLWKVEETKIAVRMVEGLPAEDLKLGQRLHAMGCPDCMAMRACAVGAALGARIRAQGPR